MKQKILCTLILSVIAQAAIGDRAVGQVITGPVPGQVSQLPPPPVPQTSIPDIRIQRRGVAPESGPPGPSVVISTLRVTGETRFSEAQLVAATGFTPGRSLSLADLRRMAALITDYYDARGYIVAQAYVPDVGERAAKNRGGRSKVVRLGPEQNVRAGRGHRQGRRSHVGGNCAGFRDAAAGREIQVAARRALEGNGSQVGDGDVPEVGERHAGR